MTIKKEVTKMFSYKFIAPNSSSLYGNYRTKTFADIWESSDAFVEDYQNAKVQQTISEESVTNLYYLLYARYGNSSIASSDPNQWKYKVWSFIFMYGPTWEKRLEIQTKIRNFTEDELRESAQAIYNHANNPSTQPATDKTAEHIMEFIDDQNVTIHKRSRTDAYALLMSLLEVDVTKQFLDRFQKLFITVVEPDYPLWYSTIQEGL